MLNYLWAFMVLTGILWGAFHGNINEVTEGALSSAKDAISLCITMLGILSLWTGILEIGQKAGLIESLSKKMNPILHFLFPRLPKEHPANKYIATNMIANILGLGWAATPAGLKAMEELANYDTESHGGVRRGIASNEMCTFLIINISSLQLIPVNMIAYRSQYGSNNPAVIVGPAIVATIISTVIGIVFAKIMDQKRGT